VRAALDAGRARSSSAGAGLMEPYTLDHSKGIDLQVRSQSATVGFTCGDDQARVRLLARCKLVSWIIKLSLGAEFALLFGSAMCDRLREKPTTELGHCDEQSEQNVGVLVRDEWRCNGRS
jgi:hypothetical protein